MMLISLATLSALAPHTTDDAAKSPVQYSPTVAVLVENHALGQLQHAANMLAFSDYEDPWSTTIVLPELHESELVARLEPGADRLYVWSTGHMPIAGLRLAYVDHDPEAFLAEVVRGLEPTVSLVSDVALPLDAWSSPKRGSLLPVLARLDGSTFLGDPGGTSGEANAQSDDGQSQVYPSRSPHFPSLRLATGAEGELLVFPNTYPMNCHGPWQVHQPLTAYWSPLHEGQFRKHREAMSIDWLVLAHIEPIENSVSVDGVSFGLVDLDENGAIAGSRAGRLASLPDWKANPDQLLEVRVPEVAALEPGKTRTWLFTVEFAPCDTSSATPQADGALMNSLHRLAGWGDSNWTPVEALNETGKRFHDARSTTGVHFSHLEGPAQQLDIRPTMGPGAAWGDVDGDGLVDLYLVQGGGREGSVVPRNRLYKNKGDGTFTDITTSSNTGDQGAGMGALFCDLDSDGDLDLYVANYGRDVLYWNDGMGVFTRAADGVIPDHDLWSAGVAAADYDRDGDLDLYITSYLDYDESKMPPMDELERYQREDPVAMLPFAFPGQRNVFLRNDVNADGLRHFRDITEELGLLDVQGRGMQAIFWDFDQDGDDDLYVANDVSYNTLFRNEGDGTFRDVTFLVGLDDPRGGMGLSVGDVDRDGDEDLFLTNWQLEANALYQNNLINRAGRKLHTGTFADHTVQSRLGPAGIGVTSWGCELFDADNDGDLDLFVANGYTSPDYEGTGICVGQPNHFFLNDGRGRFREAHEQGGSALAERLPSRGAVACDYDQDGLLDMLVTANNSRVQLLKNRGESRGHWILLRLAGSNGNTHAIGARVVARCGDDSFVASLRAGTGYLTGNASELHLGLGAHEQIDELTIHWPSGRVTTHTDLAVDRVCAIRERD